MTDAPLAFWLALVDRLVEERFAAALEEHGITRMQWRILGVLTAGPATPDAVQAALTDLPPGEDDETPAEELGELIDSGWVTSDGELTITDRGTMAHDRVAEVVAGLRNTLTNGVTDEEQTATAAVLERMARNLGWTG